jgi:hypothetical protein
LNALEERTGGRGQLTMYHRPSRYLPGLERLEGRELPSALAVQGQPSGKHQAAGPSLNLMVEVPAGTLTPSSASRVAAARGQASATPPWVDQAFLNSLAGQLYAPITTTQSIKVGNQVFPPGTYTVPQPSQAEIRRETFWVEFVGHYSVGAPRFSNQSATIHIFSNGRSVTSNQFLNGRGQVLLFPPADPTAKPTTEDPVAGQVTGLISLFSANILQSGSVLFSEATNVPGVASNDPSALDHGLPSHLAFQIDPGGVSGGTYSTPQYTTTPLTVTDPATGQAVPLTGGSGGSVAFNQGAGIIDIKYQPNNRLRAGATQSGTVLVRMQGLINLSGVLNPLYKGIN